MRSQWSWSLKPWPKSCQIKSSMKEFLRYHVHENGLQAGQPKLKCLLAWLSSGSAIKMPLALCNIYQSKPNFTEYLCQTDCLVIFHSPMGGGEILFCSICFVIHCEWISYLWIILTPNLVCGCVSFCNRQGNTLIEQECFLRIQAVFNSNQLHCFYNPVSKKVGWLHKM